MPRKIYKPEEIVAKLRQVDVLISQGQGAVEAIRAIEVTYYRWRQAFGGPKSDQVKRSRTWRRRTPGFAVHVGPDARQADPLRRRPRKLLSPARRRACIERVRGVLPISE
jgi:hypothetical protein